MTQPPPYTKNDVILIVPGGHDLGIRLLSSVLKEQGYGVVIGFFDSWHENDHAGLERILSWVREHTPTVIGISVAEIVRAKSIALITALKKEGVPVIAGGPDVTLNPDYFLTYADYIVRGEGEYALTEFVAAIVAGQDVRQIQNLWCKDQMGIVTRNERRAPVTSLDSLPFEDMLDIHHHFELRKGRIQQRQGFATDKKYVFLDNRTTCFVEASRGCATPHCSYCVSHTMVKGGFRARSVQSVIERIEKLVAADRTIGIIAFTDADFLLRSEEDINNFARTWKARVNIPFFLLCSPTTVTESKLDVLVDAGLVLVHLGVQSGSDRINYEIFKRPIPSTAVLAAVKLMSKYVGRGRFGFLPPGCEFIINNPYETEKDIMDTLQLIRQFPEPRIILVFSLVLFHGSDLYQRAVKDGILKVEKDTEVPGFADNMLDLQRRGAHYYLNSLLCWTAGLQAHGFCGIIPAGMLDFLCRDTTVKFFNTHRRIVSLLNVVAMIMQRLMKVYDFGRIRRKCCRESGAIT